MDERDPARLEFQIAIDSNGNSWTDQGVLFYFRSKLTQENNQVGFVRDSPNFPQNYGRNISTVTRNNAGIYTAIVTGTRYPYLYFLLCSYGISLSLLNLCFQISAVNLKRAALRNQV